MFCLWRCKPKLPYHLGPRRSFSLQRISGYRGFGLKRLHCTSEKIASPNNISSKLVSNFQAEFDSDKKNRLAQSFVKQHGILSGCKSADYVPQKIVHVFNTKVSDGCPHANPVSDQKSTGRCWMFAVLNTMRLPFIEKYELGEFEFSQSFLYFWDKVERANYFLHAFIETRQEEPGSRLFAWLVQDPFCDGGQWDMLVNLVNKYGIVPKDVYPETKTTESSRSFNGVITNKMREYCHTLRKLASEGKSVEQLHQEREKMVGEIYRICCISLGTPPTSFDWDYNTKKGIANSEKGLSPLRFYQDLVRPLYDLNDKICLVNDPRSDHSYLSHYTVQYLGNVREGFPVRYVNVPVQTMKEVAAKAIKSKQPVWFGCDVGKHFERQCGSLSMENFEHELTLGTSLLGLNKAERLMFGESLMTHAMVLTGVHIEPASPGSAQEKYVRWQIENSWGANSGKKGYLSMTDDWFSEFVYEVVVDKSHVSQEVVDVLKQEAVVLPPWDPMGALARARL